MTATSSSDRSRRESRERAVELAYEAAIRDCSIDVLVESLPIAPDDFVMSLLRRSESQQEKADELIGAKAKGWTISRMPVLDLAVMRIAVAELLGGETPVGVVLSEAVELAGRYSTEESSRFVNGVLAAIADDISAGQANEENLT